MRLVLLVLAGFAILAALLAWSRWLAGRRWAAGGHLLLAVACASCVASIWPVTAYVKAYRPLNSALPVAEVAFEQTGSNRFRVTVTHLPAGRMQVVEVAGSAWRLDLRLLQWADWTAPFGPRPGYRIEAFASRSERAEGTSMVRHDLAEPAAPWPWLADLAADRQQALLTARALPSPWLPMSNGARYELRLSGSGEVDVVAAATTSGAAAVAVGDE